MHSDDTRKCLDYAVRWFSGQQLYLMAGPCDQSGGELYNFVTGQIDTGYTAGSRASYITPLLEDVSPLAGDQGWYSVTMDATFPTCMCVTVFVQEGASPAETDQVVGSGSLGC